jgi:DNA-binding NarL/FixJ family response regulator
VKRTRIVLADDHALVRQGIRSLLSSIADFEVVGEAADGREALRLMRALAPDVALLDISMPELNGLDAAARALREQPRLKVIVLSMHAAELFVIEALRAGVSGYLLKHADLSELERAIRAVARGERYLAPAVSGPVIERLLRTGDDEQDGKGDALSPRQREVLQLIAEGKSTREIAERLNLSPKTVETHRAQLMQRLAIFDIAGLTRYALRIGLIDADR